MANLKGSSYSKQLKDLNYRLFAMGTKKGSDNLTHSNAVKIKRDSIVKSFINYLENNNLNGKLNQYLNEKHLNSYLEQRLDNLAVSTQENILTSLNSLLKGLNEVNITHTVPKNFIAGKLSNIKALNKNNINTKQTRGIQSNTIQKLYAIRYSSGNLGALMLDTGFRISEALKVANNPQKYITLKANGNYVVSGVIGKGGKLYAVKTINQKIYKSLIYQKSCPSHSSFNRDLKQIDLNLRPHDFRYTFARNLFDKSIKEVGYKKALKVVSKALNHNRGEISLLYLKL